MLLPAIDGAANDVVALMPIKAGSIVKNIVITAAGGAIANTFRFVIGVRGINKATGFDGVNFTAASLDVLQTDGGAVLGETLFCDYSGAGIAVAAGARSINLVKAGSVGKTVYELLSPANVAGNVVPPKSFDKHIDDAHLMMVLVSSADNCVANTKITIDYVDAMPTYSNFTSVALGSLRK